MTTFHFVAFGTAAMLLLSLLRRSGYGYSLWKAIIIPFALTVSGVIGTMILFYIEQGHWGGVSFYGSVMLIPVLMLPVAFALRIRYTRLLDYAVPQICIMLAAMKVGCFLTNCCAGILLGKTAAGIEIYFPSQITEVLTALAIMIFVLILDQNEKKRDCLYGVFFLTYGVVRFALNFFRAGITPFVWFIPAGHFWSILSVLIGATWLLVASKKKCEVPGV